MKKAVAVFSKIHLPGKTKSRLQRTLSAEEAALLHRACLHDLYQLTVNDDYEFFLFYTGGSLQEFYGPFPGNVPDGFQVLKEQKLNNFKFHQQHGMDLGERMGDRKIILPDIKKAGSG